MKDLLKLYSYESVHKSEDETGICDWICKWLKTHNIKHNRVGNTIYSLDDHGPILSAHLDQVRTNGKACHFYLTDNNHILAYNDKWQRTSLGADDKNGVWIILKLLEKGRKFSFIISEGEEVGCVGITKLDTSNVLSAISSEQFALVLDRKGNTDVLKSGGGTTFCSTLAQAISNYTGHFKVTTGSISDTKVLCKHCESVNMSVAYFNPHSATEYTDWVALQKILYYVDDLVTDFVHYSTPPKEYAPVVTASSNVKNYYSSRYYGGLYDDKEFI